VRGHSDGHGRRGQSARSDPTHGDRHGQRRAVGAVRALPKAAVPPSDGRHVRPKQVHHLCSLPLQLARLPPARPVRQRLHRRRQHRPVPVPRPVPRRIIHLRHLHLRRANNLTPTPAGMVSGFRFGCSHALQRPDLFSNTTAGIMSLGRGAQSLSSQTKGTYGHVFSYCVPPTSSHTGFFVLGVPRIAASKYVLTPMLKSKMVPSMYLVRLRGIDVAGQRVAVPPMVFAAGAVMDSRTVITRLQPTAYRALRDAFRAQMGAYRVAPPKGQLDTCYDFTGVRTLRLPKISLVFDSRSNSGAAVELDPSGVLFNSCLAFASTGAGDGSTGVIGHVQQRTIEVLYNVGGSAVGFRRAAC
uniref:Peptidase A1 domain-containing protein n=1 Tax=Aegilops tauschii subsp. strangulata TaxID=200361 RepID=A0A453QGQ8_AEGTS